MESRLFPRGRAARAKSSRSSGYNRSPTGAKGEGVLGLLPWRGTDGMALDPTPRTRNSAPDAHAVARAILPPCHYISGDGAACTTAYWETVAGPGPPLQAPDRLEHLARVASSRRGGTAPRGFSRAPSTRPQGHERQTGNADKATCHGWDGDCTRRCDRRPCRRRTSFP